MSAGRICIVTPGYIASSPRSVKEADALAAAGYDVRVVFSQGGLADIRLHDAAVLAGRSWRGEAVRWGPDGTAGERALNAWSGVRHKIFSRLALARPELAAMGESRVSVELSRSACRHKADLYIGHYPAGLAAAARAATRHGAVLGYDAEDLHRCEQADDAAGRRKTQRIRSIEGAYLPLCRHLTAVSEGVSERIAELYAVPRPVAVHNTFPWSERSVMDGKTKDRRGERLSVCWYSQTVGLDRGLQEAFRGMGRVRGRVQVHIRGRCSDPVRRALMDAASAQGIGEALHFHGPCEPGELLSRIAEHDVGLASEQPINDSRQLAVSNKLFFYMLAGLALAATDTLGQAGILRDLPKAGRLYPTGEPAGLGEWLEGLIEEPSRLAECKRASLAAARDRWNWESESRKLVDSVGKALS